MHGCIIMLYMDLSNTGEQRERERERKSERREQELKARFLDEIKE